MSTLTEYVTEARRWSGKTFGPGRRTKGILEHIRKELEEIEAAPDDLEEWIDVVILALDGFWRHGGRPEDALKMIFAKFAKNQARRWPPPGPEDQPVEHIRVGVDKGTGDTSEAVAFWREYVGQEPQKAPQVRALESLQEDGWCPICGLVRYRTPSGTVCRNGHGG